MTIVLNEHEWAKEAIDSRSIGEKPFETLYRVAKYYFDEGYKKSDVRKLLDAFLMRCDPCASLPKWSDTLDRAVTKAQKYDTIMVDKISISKTELEKVNEIEGKQVRRLAFTLLCLAKYFDAINPNANHWVGMQDKEIMKLANINTSVMRQGMMYHTLNELGLIQFSKKVDNTSVRVCFIDDGETAVEIKDMRNIGYQYLMLTGSKDYMTCQCCGNTVKYSGKVYGRRKKYCTSCASEIALRQRVEWVVKDRASQKMPAVFVEN